MVMSFIVQRFPNPSLIFSWTIALAVHQQRIAPLERRQDRSRDECVTMSSDSQNTRIPENIPYLHVPFDTARAEETRPIDMESSLDREVAK